MIQHGKGGVETIRALSRHERRRTLPRAGHVWMCGNDQESYAGNGKSGTTCGNQTSKTVDRKQLQLSYQYSTDILRNTC